MNGNDHKHELDDELLSAYLDGELLESERALVEARLASDPEAQHLLHQLRSVSQDIQSLPLKTGPRDFRDQVLQRVANTPITREATAASGPTPGVRASAPLAFQGRRPWIWASLAVAAGLLIMFLNRGDNDREHLAAVTNTERGRMEPQDPMPQRRLGEPQDQSAPAAADPALVAKSETALPPSAAATPTTPMMAPPADASDLSDQVASSGRRVAESSSVSEGSPVVPELKVPLSDVPSDESIRTGNIVATAPSPPPAPAATPASPTVGGLASGGERGPAGMARPAAAPEQPSARPLPAGPAGPVAGRGGGSGGAAANQPLERFEELAPTLVVHVVAKKYALDNKAFEDLLAKNHIQLESNATTLAFEEARRANGIVNRSSKAANADRFAGQVEAKTTDSAQEVELLEVEASRQSIESCLTELQQDSANYAGVAIEKVALGQEGAEKSESADKKLVTDLSRFNRGNISQTQKDIVPEKLYAFGGGKDRADTISLDTAKAKSETSESSGKPSQQAEQLKESKQLPAIQDGVEKESLGRARRLTPVELQQRGMDRLSTSGVVRAQVPDVATRAKTQSELAPTKKADADGMRVLFVITPEPATATSAPAEKPPK